MVEIKRTRAGQGYKLSRIGVVNVQSGSEQVYEQKAKGYGQFADFMFEQTASMQKEAGAKFAAEVEVLDDNGKVVSKKIPSGLGKFGQEVAVKEINRRMSVATQNEMKSVAAQFKQAVKGSSDPANAFRLNMETYLAQRTKDITESGGEDFIPTLNEIAYNIGALAEIDIKLEKQDQVNKKNESDLRIYSDDQLASVTTLFSNGKVEEATNLVQSTIQAIEESTLPPSAKASLVRQQKTNASVSLVNSVVKGSSSNQMRRLSEEAGQLSFSNETLEKFPELKKLGDMEAGLWQSIATDLNTTAGKIAIQQSNVSKAKQAEDLLAYRTSGQVFDNNKSAREALDFHLLSGGVDTSNIFSQEAVTVALETSLAAPFASNVLKRSFANLGGSGVYEPEDIQRAVNIWNNVTQDKTGTEYGFSEKTTEHMMRLNSLMQVKGGDPLFALEMSRRIPRNDPADSAAVQSFTEYKTDSGNPSRDIDSMARRYIKENYTNIRPEHVESMSNLAASLMISDSGSVEQVVSDMYEVKFPRSKFIVPTAYDRDNGNKARSQHAPEKYLTSKALGEFEVDLQAKLEQYTSDDSIVIGEDVFLDVVLGANNIAQWKFVNKVGVPIQNANGKEVIFGAELLQKYYADMQVKKTRDAERIRAQHVVLKSKLSSPMRIVD